MCVRFTNIVILETWTLDSHCWYLVIYTDHNLLVCSSSVNESIANENSSVRSLGKQSFHFCWANTQEWNSGHWCGTWCTLKATPTSNMDGLNVKDCLNPHFTLTAAWEDVRFCIWIWTTSQWKWQADVRVHMGRSTRMKVTAGKATLSQTQLKMGRHIPERFSKAQRRGSRWGWVRRIASWASEKLSPKGSLLLQYLAFT